MFSIWPFLPQVQQGMTVQNRATALQSEEMCSSSGPQKSLYNGQFHEPYCLLSYAALNHCLIDVEVALIIRFCWKQIMKKNKSPARDLMLGENILNAFEAASEPWLGLLDEVKSNRTGGKLLNCAKWQCLRDPFPCWFIAATKKMRLKGKEKLMISPP